MPKFHITAPDGTKYDVDAPEGATEEEALARVKAEHEALPSTILKQGARDLARGTAKSLIGAGESLLGSGQISNVPGPDGRSQTVRHPFFKMAEGALDKVLPESPPGYRRSVAEGVGGALASPAGPIGPVRAAFAGGAAGASGEAATRLLGDSPWIRTIAELIGGGAAGLAGASRTNRRELAKESLEGVDPTHLGIARQRMVEAREGGVPINVSQGMPRASNLDDIVEALASSRHGDNVIAQLREQPERLHLRAKIELPNLPGTATSMQDQANRVQEGATAAIKGGQKKANAAFRRELPAGTQVEAGALQAFDKRLSDYIAANPKTHMAGMAESVRKALQRSGAEAAEAAPLGAGKVAGRIIVKGEAKPPEWITDAGQLKNAIDTQISEYGASRLADPSNARRLDRAANEIRALFDRTVATPGSPLRNARAAAREVHVEEVNPMKKSVTGRLAGIQGAADDREAVASKLATVFAKGTPKSGRSEILTLEKDLRKVDSTIFTDAVKTNISERLTAVMPVGDQKVPHNFAALTKKALMDNPAQEQGLRDMLAGVARAQGRPESEVVNGFMGFMRLSVMAMDRPPKVTGLPQADLNDIAQKSARADALHGPFGALAAMGKNIRMGLSADAYRTIDKLLTTPEGLDALRALAKTSLMSHKAQNIVASFYATMGTSDGPQE